jgi:hypothetical protein
MADKAEQSSQKKLRDLNSISKQEEVKEVRRWTQHHPEYSKILHRSLQKYARSEPCKDTDKQLANVVALVYVISDFPSSEYSLHRCQTSRYVVLRLKLVQNTGWHKEAGDWRGLPAGPAACLSACVPLGGALRRCGNTNWRSKLQIAVLHSAADLPAPLSKARLGGWGVGAASTRNFIHTSTTVAKSCLTARWLRHTAADKQ